MVHTSEIKKSFRHDINALRAVAVLGVVFFHYKLPFFHGGFIGVDIFFVISGYLMSKIIITSINDKKFSYSDYIKKRAARIIPALLFLVLVLAIICFLFYLPEDYKTNQKNAAASILFLSNILYWQSSNSYFSPTSDTNIFLHTWSLSVEWQFYLFYPVVLLIAQKIFKSKRLYILIFVISTLFIFILAVTVTNYKANASFYLLPTRSWEMLFGGIAFLTDGFIKTVYWRKILAIIGYASLIACILLFNVGLPWPSIYTMLPVAATFLVISANFSQISFIRQPNVQFFGKISYSLYLWHWPVYVLAQYFGIRNTVEIIFLLTILSISLGYISYKYIENIKADNILIISTATAITFVITAILSHFNINNFVFKKETLYLANYENLHKKDVDIQMRKGYCFVEPNGGDFKRAQCLCLDKHKKNILLIGDSHAAQLASSLKTYFEFKNINLIQATVAGVLPTIGGEDSENNKVMHYIYDDFVPKNSNNIDGVILTAHWLAHWKESNNDKPVGILDGINATIKYFTKYHIKIIVIGQSEKYTIPYPTIAARNYEYNINSNNNYLDYRCYTLDSYLSKNLDKNYIQIINTENFPTISPKNELYMWDTNHVTQYGSNLIIDKILLNPYAQKIFKQ